MPQVNLTAMTGPQLREMLDASRRRGDAALSYKILQEMAARRETQARRPFLARRQAEPRLVAVEDEPAEADDLPPLPHWRAPPPEPAAPAAPPAKRAAAPATPPPKRAAAPPPAPRRSRRKTQPPAAPVAAVDVEPPPPSPPPAAETSPPLSLRSADPSPPRDETADMADQEDTGLQLDSVATQPPRAPRQPRPRAVAAFALGIPIGIAVGWWAAEVTRQLVTPPARPPVAAIRTAALAPRPAPVVPAPVAASVPEPAPDASPEPDAGPPPPDAATAPPPNAQAAAGDANSRAAEPPPAPVSRTAEAVKSAETAPPPPERSAARAANACAGAPTPADREICGDPELRRLQRELHRAYAQALEAHQDRALLRQRQLAWRDARNAVTDPDRLAQLYEQRIHKLNAATAQARRQR